MNMFTCSGLLLALAALAGGCSSPSAVQPRGARQMWVSEDLRTASIQQAIIAQHALYPYHFVADAAELNELGEHDLEVLAAHFAHHDGSLNLKRGGVSGRLYQERIDFVRAALVKRGVSKGKIRILDGRPGGDGISSERVFGIMEDDTELGAAPTVESSAGQGSN